MNRSTRRAKPRHKQSHTYSTLDILLASTRPMPADQRLRYIAGFTQALQAIQFEPVSTPEHWRVMADAVNLVETFCMHPWPDPDAPGELIDIADEADTIPAAVEAMREAARLHKMQGGNIRLSAQGREALAALVDMLDTILQTLSHRSTLQCHNECETALRKHRADRRANVVTL